MAGGKDNLIPVSQRTPEELREMTRKGGIASGKARRAKKSFRDAAKWILEKETQAVIDGELLNITQYEALVLSLWKQSQDPKNKQQLQAIQTLQNMVGDPLAQARAKAEIERIKADIKRIEGETGAVNTAVYNGIPATLIAPTFQAVLLDIEEHGHTEYDFPGGRGSTKSSFVSLEIVDFIMKNPDMHACAIRKVGNTLRDSCYAKICWAISQLGLDGQFECTVSPLEITRKATGQKIYFRGADDPNKLKSITPKDGYLAILWFEEMDQFAGESELRTIKQSIIRGGDDAIIFCTFNPPKSLNNWANDYVMSPSDMRLVTRSNYLSVPKRWLGKAFLDIAEELKEKNHHAYENEYMGVANGSGGNVFDNVECREITDHELSEFDNLLFGVDWGWYPDPYAFVKVHYDAARMTLYILQEHVVNKKSNRETADDLIALGVTEADIVTCDSAEEKSVSDYRSYGINARAAEKGPDSRRYSYKWLQSLVKIVIDPKRCPIAAKEFIHYEYERDKDGNVISGYPDGNDHCIDAVRYATNRIWKRRGQ